MGLTDRHSLHHTHRMTVQALSSEENLSSIGICAENLSSVHLMRPEAIPFTPSCSQREIIPPQSQQHISYS